ncbi:MAG: LPS export ABC transporter ATP-binding protein [Rickettsiales bacterium]|nr:LPS export ABC transporter ATP-binding protein [Rickettsiales bacterium]
MTTSVLRVEHLQKSYKDRLVIKNINLEIKSGEVVGLLGPNGAGKTTSFYMIVGLVKPDNGKIILNDNDITNFSIYDRAEIGIGYLPQEASIFRNMTVEDNIYSILEIVKNNKKERVRKLRELLEDFSITHIRKSLGSSLSGGERRRVEIARALASDPSFILLDEPFAGIDPIAVNDIMSIIKKLKDKGIGVLITDHNVRETLAIVDKAYIVYNGEILISGNKNDITENNLVKKVYLGEHFGDL